MSEFPIPKPKLFEGLLTDPEYKGELAGRAKAFEESKWGARYVDGTMKEGLLRDTASALGRMHNIVVNAAVPGLIGREMIDVMPTTEAMVRFPRAKKAKGLRSGEVGTWILPEKSDYVDIKTDIILRAGFAASKEFIEDASWNVMERQGAELGRAIAEVETEKVIALYTAIAAADLASGAVNNGAGTFSWAGLVKFWKLINKENFHSNVIALNPEQMADLWEDDKFIHGFYFGNQADVRRGVLGDSYLGMKIVNSTKMTDATVIAADTNVSAVMLIRRDITIEPFEDPKENQFGLIASERVGLGVLRSKGVSRGTGW